MGQGRAGVKPVGQGRQTPGEREAGYVVGRPERGLGVGMQPMEEAAIVLSPLDCPRASGIFLWPLAPPSLPRISSWLLGGLLPIVGAPELSQREGNRTFSNFYVIFVCPAGNCGRRLWSKGVLWLALTLGDPLWTLEDLFTKNSFFFLPTFSPLLTHSPEKILLLPLCRVVDIHTLDCLFQV